MQGKTVYNPNNPDHYMTVTSPGRPVRAYIGGFLIAQSDRVLLVSEVGSSKYPPVYYFPIKDVLDGVLEPAARSTHCPLKGDTCYFHVKAGNNVHPHAGWEYDRPLEGAGFLKGHVAFDANSVTIKAD